MILAPPRSTRTETSFPTRRSSCLDRWVEQTRWAMGQILAGEATPAQVAGFAVALRSKGETVDEVVGLVEAMFEKAAPLSIPGRSLDIVGTGGDRKSTRLNSSH